MAAKYDDDEYKKLDENYQSPSRVVVRYSHHTPLQRAKCQESCQTEENVFYYCLTVSCVT